MDSAFCPGRITRRFISTCGGAAPGEPEALRALESVHVIVFVSDGLVAAGLDIAALRTSIEVELRRDGVLLSDAFSALYAVSVTGLQSHNRASAATGFVVASRAGLYQSVRVSEAPAFIGAGHVWITDDDVNTTGDDIQALRETVRNSARTNAQHFANDWLKVHNPQKR